MSVTSSHVLSYVGGLILFLEFFHTRNKILGAASPQAVKKLLALSEQTKPRHKSHPGVDRDQPSPGHPKPERVEQPTPVNLTSESSSVSGRPKDRNMSKTKVRKVQNSIGSITSSDSGFGAEKERLERNQSESPQLQNRRRYHQHYHRQQHNHGKYDNASQTIEVLVSIIYVHPDTNLQGVLLIVPILKP